MLSFEVLEQTCDIYFGPQELLTRMHEIPQMGGKVVPRSI